MKNTIEKINTNVIALSTLNSVYASEIVDFTKTCVISAIKKIAEKLTCSESISQAETFLAILICLRNDFREFRNAETLRDLSASNLLSKFACDATTQHKFKDLFNSREFLHQMYNCCKQFICIDENFAKSDMFQEFLSKQNTLSHSNNFQIVDTRINVTTALKKRFIDFRISENFFEILESDELTESLALIEMNMTK